MPATSKKQLNYFKLVKSYKEGGIKSFFNMWRTIFKDRPFPDKTYIDTVAKTAQKIKPEDIEDMTSGLKGDDILGDLRDFKVGYWALFKGRYRDYKNTTQEGEFIAQINRVDFKNKIVNFNAGSMYNKFGGRIATQNRAIITDLDFPFMDYAYFKDVIKTSKNKNEIIEKRGLFAETTIINKKEQTMENKKILKKIIEEALLSEDIGIAQGGDDRYGDYQGMLAEENVLDSNGKKIITGRLVRDKNNLSKCGKVLGLTDALDARVEWFLPMELAKTVENMKPMDLIVYA